MPKELWKFVKIGHFRFNLLSNQRVYSIQQMNNSPAERTMNNLNIVIFYLQIYRKTCFNLTLERSDAAFAKSANRLIGLFGKSCEFILNGRRRKNQFTHKKKLICLNCCTQRNFEEIFCSVKGKFHLSQIDAEQYFY